MLPKELPPLFTSTAFAQRCAPLFGAGLTIPDRPPRSALVRFSHSKYASTRRELGIPNPAPFYWLAKTLAEQWSSIVSVCRASTLSRSKPIDSTSRAVESVSAFADLPQFRAKVRAAGRYSFRTDIASFYHSIYTHSIPWAVHGKAAAKVNRSITPKPKGPPILWGNLADLYSRNLQEGQTIGLPVGPDTSFVLAETILCSLDQKIQERLGDCPAFRFVDDYEFVCDSQPEAERVLALLQEVLDDFELKLNPRKTHISELPEPLDTSWVHDLSAFEFNSDSVNPAQLIRYFTLAFEVARAHPGEPVLKYATRRLKDIVAEQDSATLIQRLLLQAAVADPGTLHFALHTFQKHKDADLEVDCVSLARALNALVCRHAPLGHGSEVTWCIWASAAFDVTLDEQATDSVSKMADDIVALTALRCEPDGAFARPLDRALWTKLSHAENMHGEHWLIAYESLGQGWIPLPPAGDPALASKHIAPLRRDGVSFLNLSAKYVIPEPDSGGPSS